MTNKHHTIVNYILILCSIVLLSSCANQSYYGKSSVRGSQMDSIGKNTTREKDGQSPDSDMCLDQELTALSETGAWSKQGSSMSFDPTQNVKFDFPVVLNKQVEMYLDYFQNGFRDNFATWLETAGSYAPIMESALAEAGLPKDLIYLAMIESGYNPFACSKSMAVGLWQFMEATGSQYNLQINKYIDERRDPEKSTHAAIAFLSDLYKEFGDWHLAVAAYNGGPAKIRNGLTKYQVDNFWDLASKDYLALETKRYVPKLIAALIIAKQPEKFGFTQLTPRTPPKYDVLTVGPGMGLEAIALITNSSVDKIKQLNQELRLNKTPLNMASYDVKIPFATLSLAKKNMPLLHSAVTVGFKSHKVSKGDTLDTVCALYDVSKTTLLKANNLRTAKLSNGQSLRVPYNIVSYQLLPENIAKAKTANNNNLVMHNVKNGETVSYISKLYNVQPEMIMTWNNLKNVKSVKPGQQLALYISPGNPPAPINENNTKIASVEKNISVAKHKSEKVVLKSEKMKTHIVSDKSHGLFASYNVKDGDTLYTISQKFSASTSEIKKWNNLKSDLIYPGDVLKLKKG